MEAPESIYLIPDDRCPRGLSICWYEAPYSTGAVEYTRTDAFIEKAVGYFNSKLYDWVQTTNPNQRSCANTIMKQDFIEDFVNYMKGE